MGNCNGWVGKMGSTKLKILQNTLGGYFKVGGECLFKCPACDHYKNKLSVNVEKNAFKCWVCDYSGTNLYFLVKRYGTHESRSDWRQLDSKIEITDFDSIFQPIVEVAPLPQRIELPEEFITLTSRNLPLSASPALNYLKGRGVGKEDILRWKIGYCPTGEYKNRIIIPSFDEEGYVNYFIARTYTGDWPQYKNPPISKDIIFNDIFTDWGNDVVIVEGAFDAIKAGNAVPILGSTLGEKNKLFQRLVSRNPKIFLALDADAEKKALRIIKNLLEYDMNVYKVDISPYSDVGEMSEEEFSERKEKASFVSGGDYLLYHTIGL